MDESATNEELLLLLAWAWARDLQSRAGCKVGYATRDGVRYLVVDLPPLAGPAQAAIAVPESFALAHLLPPYAGDFHVSTTMSAHNLRFYGNYVSAMRAHFALSSPPSP